MADIVQVLRGLAFDKDNMPRMRSEQWLPVGVGLSAADEIEKLRKENASLQQELHDWLAHGRPKHPVT